MPEVGTDGHVALLLAEHLAARISREEPGIAEQELLPCPEADLHRLVRRLAGEHRAYWRRSAREPGAERGLVEHALERLEALRLIRREPGLVRPLPALARYGLAAPTFPDETTQTEIAA
jgi:uncharacterized protein (TIGR02678 family)